MRDVTPRIPLPKSEGTVASSSRIETYGRAVSETPLRDGCHASNEFRAYPIERFRVLVAVLGVSNDAKVLLLFATYELIFSLLLSGDAKFRR